MKKNSTSISLTVHCLVRNEDIWISYALRSVLPFADKIFVFDNGPSTDKTVEVIKSIKSKKIIFEEKGKIEKKDLAKLRQEMTDRTKTEWFLVLDGDEVWPKKQLEKLLKLAEKTPKNIVGLVNYTRNCIGDVYHYLPETFGQYQIAGKIGNLNIRLIRKTSTLRIVREYPLEIWVDGNGPIQQQAKNLLTTDCWYLHTTYLQRSSLVATKKSGSFGKSKFWEKGISLKKEEIPEVLFEKKNVDTSFCSLVDPLKKRGLTYETIAAITSPLLQVRRKLRQRLNLG